MRDHRRSEISRLRTAALTCVFTRSLALATGGVATGGAGGAVLRGLPAGRPASLSRGVPCKLFTKSTRRCSVSGTRFNVLVVHNPVSVAKRCSSDSVVLPSHIPRTNLAPARPFLTSLRTLPLGDTANRNRAASANFITSPWLGRQATTLRVSPTTAIHPWQVPLSLRDVLPSRALSIESDLPLRLVHWRSSVPVGLRASRATHLVERCGEWPPPVPLRRSAARDATEHAAAAPFSASRRFECREQPCAAAR